MFTQKPRCILFDWYGTLSGYKTQGQLLFELALSHYYPALDGQLLWYDLVSYHRDKKQHNIPFSVKDCSEDIMQVILHNPYDTAPHNLIFNNLFVGNFFTQNSDRQNSDRQNSDRHNRNLLKETCLTSVEEYFFIKTENINKNPSLCYLLTLTAHENNREHPTLFLLQSFFTSLLKKSYSQAFKGFHATENPMTLLCMHVFFLQENIVQNYPSREEYATLLRYSKEILVFLKSHHVTLALCSNQKEDFLKKEVSSCHSAEFFDSIRGVKALIAPKPSVDLLMHSLRDLNLPHSPPESVWFVGDSFSDQEAARGMNLPFIGLGLEFNHHKKDTSYFFNNRDLYYFLKQQW